MMLGLLTGSSKALMQENIGIDLTQCLGDFKEDIKLLNFDCLGLEQNSVIRFQRLFSRPLYQNCNQVNKNNLVIPNIGGGLLAGEE